MSRDRDYLYKEDDPAWKPYEESSYYRWILLQGAIQQPRKLILRLGGLRFGAPDAAIVSLVEAMDDLDQLDDLFDRLWIVNSWQELFESS